MIDYDIMQTRCGDMDTEIWKKTWKDMSAQEADVLPDDLSHDMNTLMHKRQGCLFIGAGADDHLSQLPPRIGVCTVKLASLPLVHQQIWCYRVMVTGYLSEDKRTRTT